jgi:cellulose synthase/poly-beta-1,6-N-acetylglucosamine synthase-like glycosyltransferase
LFDTGRQISTLFVLFGSSAASGTTGFRARARRIRQLVTVIVPAFNEAGCIAESLDIADVARTFGVTVIRPPANTGSKAGAQTFALDYVKTEFVVAVDADTTLAPDALEKLLPALANPEVAAACGMVLPRLTRTLWERGRYVEYLFAFTFYKRVQDAYGAPLISSGRNGPQRQPPLDRIRQKSTLLGPLQRPAPPCT